jgi:hypothetical protein
MIDLERAGRRHLSRNRAAQALGMQPVEQIVEIVSARRPARKMHSACRETHQERDPESPCGRLTRIKGFGRMHVHAE